MKWFRKSAEQGDELGESNLGWMYGHGAGVEQDYDLAEIKGSAGFIGACFNGEVAFIGMEIVSQALFCDAQFKNKEKIVSFFEVKVLSPQNAQSTKHRYGLSRVAFFRLHTSHPSRADNLSQTKLPSLD